MLNSLFSVERIALVRFRVLLSIAVLCDAFLQIRHFRPFDSGNIRLSQFYSVPNLVLFLLGLQIVFAIGLSIGKKSKFFSISSWLVHSCLVLCNPYLRHIGDAYLSVLLFYSMFLPLEKVSSNLKYERVRSFAIVAVSLHVLFIYLISGLSKLSTDVWRQGFGIYYALAADEYTTGIGMKTLTHPFLATALNYLTMGIEILAFFALVTRFCKQWVLRNSLFFALIAVHIGILFCMKLVGIQLVGMAGLMLFYSAYSINAEAKVMIESKPKKIALGFFLFLALTMGLMSLPKRTFLNDWYYHLKNPVFAILGIQQSWGAYSRPYIRKVIRVSALKNDGQMVNLADDSPIDEESSGRVRSERSLIWADRLEKAKLPQQNFPLVVQASRDHSFFSDAREGVLYMSFLDETAVELRTIYMKYLCQKLPLRMIEMNVLIPSIDMNHWIELGRLRCGVFNEKR